ncbi:DUF6406 domain-containing protein [Streptomyces sp. NPDC005485]|uniref:DUF6406 domain-containing protein n=1 Tax=Streptomyces sp. NPDC005485 TaxID=3155591 RepID=UPI0033B8F7DF
MIKVLMLGHGVAGRVADARFITVQLHTPEGAPPVLTLCVVTDQERDYDLHVGETFPVLGDTWRLDRIDGIDTEDWQAILRKVE